MRTSRVAAAAVALVLAVAAGLLAHDVRSWRDAFRAGDLRFAASPGSRESWSASAAFPGDPAAGLLGVDDDRTLRSAVRLFVFGWRAGPGFDNGFSARRIRGVAEAALSQAAQNPDPQLASQAYDLLGLLAFSDSSSGAGGSAVSSDRAVTALQHAVSLDRANEAAKANLELLLRLLVAHGVKVGPTATSGPRASGRRGAGSGTPGAGY